MRRLQQIPKLGRDRLLMCRDERVELLEVELMSVVLASHGFEATTEVIDSSDHCGGKPRRDEGVSSRETTQGRSKAALTHGRLHHEPHDVEVLGWMGREYVLGELVLRRSRGAGRWDGRGEGGRETDRLVEGRRASEFERWSGRSEQENKREGEGGRGSGGWRLPCLRR